MEKLTCENFQNKGKTLVNMCRCETICANGIWNWSITCAS